MKSEFKLPEIGDQVPRRSDPRTQKLAIRILRHLGWEIKGEIPNLPRLVVIGAPHTSNWDGLIAMSLVQALQVRIVIMGKDSIFKIPGVNQFLRWLGLVPIDRGSPQGIVEQSAGQLKAADQLWLGLAPEGTRKKAAKWKNGFYRIAILAEVPILMLALDFGRRELRFSGLLTPTGNYSADLGRILAFFDAADPCRPEMLSAPLARLRLTRLGNKSGHWRL